MTNTFEQSGEMGKVSRPVKHADNSQSLLRQRQRICRRRTGAHTRYRHARVPNWIESIDVCARAHGGQSPSQPSALSHFRTHTRTPYSSTYATLRHLPPGTHNTHTHSTPKTDSGMCVCLCAWFYVPSTTEIYYPAAYNIYTRGTH